MSNDSFQEFHDRHPWLFGAHRLVGGKRVAHVGWVFSGRVPVRARFARTSGGVMTETPLPELARLLAELAEAIATTEPSAHRIARRARSLCRPLHPGDPARWAAGEQTVTVEVDVPARVVVETLANERTGAVIVVSSNGPVGIIAERDVVSALAAGKNLDELSATDLVAADLVTAHASATIGEVANSMIAHRVRHLPLVEGDRIVTMVSSLDLLRALTRTTDE